MIITKCRRDLTFFSLSSSSATSSSSNANAWGTRARHNL